MTCMNRRSYLSSIAALTAGAGCLGRASDGTPDRVGKTVSVSDVGRTTPDSVENVDADERPTHLEFDVEVRDATITANSTARIALEYTNTGADALELNVYPEQPDPVSSVDANPGLILLSDAYDPARTSDTCWKPERDAFAVPAVAHQHPIEAGGTATLPYGVWASPDQGAECIEPGTYQFDPLFGSFTLAVRRDGSD